MDGADGGTRLTPAEKEIARKQTLLNEEERKRYERHIDLGIERYGPITDQYRLGVLNTLLQPIPEREQDRQINGHFRDEYYRVFDNDRRAEREAHEARLKARAASHKPAPIPAKEPEPPARANDNRFIRSQHEKEKPPGLREGIEPHGSEYSDLVQTHERVAGMQRKGAGQSVAVEVTKQAEALQRPRTRQEYIERQRRAHAERLEQGPQRPNALAPSKEQPAHVREAEDKKTAQQEAAKNPTQQPGASQKLKSKQEYLEKQRQGHAKHLEKAAQRRAGEEITQQAKGAQQQRGPSFGGGISR